MQRASQILGELSHADKRVKDPESLLDQEQIACACWARAVGRKIAQHTRPTRLVRGRLIVEVEDAMWQRNLFLLTRHIVSNLNQALGTGIVNELEFRVVPARREPQRAATSQAADDSDSISDPGLRRLYRAARHRELA